MEARTTAEKEMEEPGRAEAPAVTLMAEAAEKIRSLLEGEGRTDLKLRVYVTGGGCAGFQYNFAFDEKVEEDDLAIESGGVTVLVDPRSLPYLAGAQIRYEEDLGGARFVVVNPNAASTCSCGSSFSTCSQSKEPGEGEGHGG